MEIEETESQVSVTGADSNESLVRDGKGAELVGPF